MTGTQLFAPELRALELAVVFALGLAVLSQVSAKRGQHEALLRHLALAGYALAALAALLYATLLLW